MSNAYKIVPALQVHPHGSVDCLPFDAMGSGSLNAMSMLETKYKDDMSQAEAMDLVAAAIKFGAPIFRSETGCALT